MIYRETHRQYVIGTFSGIVLPLLRSFDHRTYIDSDMIWMSRGLQTLLCDRSDHKDGLRAYRIIYRCSVKSSCGNCYSDDGEIHSRDPAHAS